MTNHLFSSGVSRESVCQARILRQAGQIPRAQYSAPGCPAEDTSHITHSSIAAARGKSQAATAIPASLSPRSSKMRAIPKTRDLPPLRPTGQNRTRTIPIQYCRAARVHTTSHGANLRVLPNDPPPPLRAMMIDTTPAAHSPW